MYEDKTPEAIKAEILAAIRQSQGLSAMAGGFADGVAGPVAEQLSEAYRALEGCPPCCLWTRAPGATSTWWAGSITASPAGRGQGPTAT